MTSNETNRLIYVDRLLVLSDKSFQMLRSQYPSTSTSDLQFHQPLHTFLSSILELLSYITGTNIDLSIKIKLVLSTCLVWLIKHSQGNYCKKHYKTICQVFKNILLNGQSNNRQLAKYSVSIIILLGNFVHPQMVLNELIDDQFQYYNYRIQLELLAIVTATLIKHRQHHYDSISSIYKHLLPMLVSNRRELRHGAMECFTVICTYFNAYKPLTSTMIDTNQSIKLVLSLIDKLSYDASHALRFRLQPLVPQVCQRKPKQVEIHLLPTYWKLLTQLRGQNSTTVTSSAGGVNTLNSSIHSITSALYAELGSTLIDKASSSSSVTPKNLQLLRELCTSIDAV
ncbi:unnamed protein product [Adineta steineri]|uniref:Uncharacterized protein n=1 Tax=Adineta steineri TaxID=433720 RepID=A0A815TTZ2_9BILA|nr:unnamed protein product [Adineta steineri]